MFSIHDFNSFYSQYSIPSPHYIFICARDVMTDHWIRFFAHFFFLSFAYDEKKKKEKEKVETTFQQPEREKGRSYEIYIYIYTYIKRKLHRSNIIYSLIHICVILSFYHILLSIACTRIYVGIIQEDAKYMASVVVVGLATVKVLPCKSRTTVFQNRCDDCVRPQPTYLTIGRCTAPQFPSLLWTIGCSRNTYEIHTRTLIPSRAP